MRGWWFVVVLGCGGSSATTEVDAPGGDGSDPDSGGLVSLDKTPTTYRETCDGSDALALSFTHFLDVNDENQSLRIYERAKPTAPVQAIPIDTALGLAANAEADLEDVERVGNRLYVTTSHGRKTSGALDRARYKFAAFDITGTAPNVTLAPVGVSNQLLDQMLVAANWDTPNATVIAALQASSQLNDTNEATLAPEMNGTNIEGLTHDGTGKLLIGFRNPRPGNKAIVVSLTNPDVALTGTARFGSATELDLGGLGIRSMAYSATHAAVLIIAGPHAGTGPFKLYKWVAPAQPVFISDISTTANNSPEAIVPYPNTKDVQIVFDGGDADVNGAQCKDAPIADQVFRDAVTTVE